MKDTLMLFPCCADKVTGGQEWQAAGKGLEAFVSEQCMLQIKNTRWELLKKLKETERYMTGKYAKNTGIDYGPDFVSNAKYNAKYLPAIERYCGSLYTAVPKFADGIKRRIAENNYPKLLILSALYGPLHPLDLIQDYNLMMSDSPARSSWKKAFPYFLKEYVKTNEIKQIVMYFGGSTKYLEVAKQAVELIHKDVSLKRVIQIEVENGNAYHTPHNHGLLLAKNLGLVKEINLTRRVKEIVLFER